MKMHECYLKQGSLWIIPGSKIPTWSRQWKMPQAAKEYKPTNNVLCSEERRTPNFAGCLTLSVQPRVCSEGEGKTSRLLLNQKERVFLSRSGRLHKFVVRELKVSDYWSPAQSIM